MNAQNPHTAFGQVGDIINRYAPISLKEMDRVALMKRTDTKFVLPRKVLIQLLKEIQDEYKVLQIGPNRIMSYRSLYFDVAGTNKFYYDHHNGRINRTKIRMRKYIESNLCFLEIKQKDAKGRTNKSRIVIPDFEEQLSNTSTDFVKKITQQDYNLVPTLWNQFHRMTLVHKVAKERVTIDFNLAYDIDESSASYNDVVIVELKQERYDRSSSVAQVLKKYRNHPYSISKYCIGMISLYKDLKYNSFKAKLLKINKINRG